MDRRLAVLIGTAPHAMAAATPAPPATETEKETKTVTKDKVRLAPQYRVLVHNDDVTTFEFVISVLVEIFKKEQNAALEIAALAHFNGLALVGVFPLEIAELRVDQAHSKARAAKYPLKLTYEPET